MWCIYCPLCDVFITLRDVSIVCAPRADPASGDNPLFRPVPLSLPRAALSGHGPLPAADERPLLRPRRHATLRHQALRRPAPEGHHRHLGRAGRADAAVRLRHRPRVHEVGVRQDERGER